MPGNKPMTGTCFTNKSMDLITIAKTFVNRSENENPEKPPQNKRRKLNSTNENADPYFTRDCWHPPLNQTNRNAAQKLKNNTLK